MRNKKIDAVSSISFYIITFGKLKFEERVAYVIDCYFQIVLLSTLLSLITIYIREEKSLFHLQYLFNYTPVGSAICLFLRTMETILVNRSKIFFFWKAKHGQFLRQM